MAFSDGSCTLATANTANATPQFWAGGRGLFLVEASAYGTAKLQYKTPAGTWVDVDAVNANLAANGMVGVELPPGQVQVVLAGTTGASAWLLGTRLAS